MFQVTIVTEIEDIAMNHYTKEELTEALRAVNSIIHKCEKAQEKFPEGDSHYTLLRNRLKAMYISKALITEALSTCEMCSVVPESPKNI